MTHGSLFSGIGGFDLAAQWMGWENAFHCEINPFGRHVLNYYWPKAISYEDITKTDFTVWRGRIDVLTGGFPCQPFSLAGKRKGTEDERHLWPEMLRAIREIKPRWIVGENVFGLVNWDGGLVFEQVQADLEAEGYEVQPYILPACAVGAPHRRDRVWFVAHAIDSHARGASGRHEGAGGTERIQERNEMEQSGEPSGIWGISTDPSIKGLEKPGQTGFGKHEAEDREWMVDRPEQLCRYASDPNGQQRRKGGVYATESETAKRHTGAFDTRGDWRTWSDFPTQSPVRGRNDGIPSGLAGITVSKHRNESIKAYGNAIVPQVVYQIFKSIQQYES